MAHIATASFASKPCIPTAFTRTNWCRWNRMTCTAGSDKNDFLLCFIKRKLSQWKVPQPFRLLFHFRLRQPRWRHRRTINEDKNKSDFSVCTAKSPSESHRIFEITSELTPVIGRSAANSATKRSHNILTWEHIRAFTRAKSHSNATIVTRASRKLSR